MGIWHMHQVYDGHTHTTPHYEGWKPVYSQPIRVIDSLARTLPLSKRSWWRNCRNAALAEWAVGGLPLEVERGPAKTWEGGYKNPTWYSNYVHDAIVFVRLKPTEEYPQSAWAPHVPPDMGLVGLALNLPDAFTDFKKTRSVIAHEFGHALGFGHGGTGIMMGAYRPNLQEIACVGTYYGL